MSFDPIAARRRTAVRAARAGKRIGYGAMLAAIVAFFVGAATSFPRASVIVVIGCLVVSCLVLPFAIVLGYAVRAAEREERGQRPSH